MVDNTHKREVNRLRAINADLLAACEAVEWVSRTGSGGQFCPWCNGLYPEHAGDCMRQVAIARAKGENDDH